MLFIVGDYITIATAASLPYFARNYRKMLRISTYVRVTVKTFIAMLRGLFSPLMGALQGFTTKPLNR